MYVRDVVVCMRVCVYENLSLSHTYAHIILHGPKNVKFRLISLSIQFRINEIERSSSAEKNVPFLHCVCVFVNCSLAHSFTFCPLCMCVGAAFSASNAGYAISLRYIPYIDTQVINTISEY